VEEAVALGEELAHPFSLAFALDFAGAGVGMLLRDVSMVHAHVEMLMKLSREQGFAYWLAWGAVRQGWVLAERGDGEAGIARMREGMDTVQRTGAELSTSYVLAQLAEAHGKLGREGEGLRLLAEALAHIEKTGERWYEAELHRLKGELLRPQNRAAAEACFQRAIEVAMRQHAKSFGLRASTSLARLWQHTAKKRRAAREMLGDISARSPRVRDADLRDARALLAELQ
jgi:predicted ATPase